MRRGRPIAKQKCRRQLRRVAPSMSYRLCLTARRRTGRLRHALLLGRRVAGRRRLCRPLLSPTLAPDVRPGSDVPVRVDRRTRLVVTVDVVVGRHLTVCDDRCHRRRCSRLAACCGLRPLVCAGLVSGLVCSISVRSNQFGCC